MITAEELHKLYWTDKLSMTEIGEKFNTNKETIRNRMRAFGIPKRDRRTAAMLRSTPDWTEERDQMLWDLWPTSMTCKEIGKRLGLTYNPRAISHHAKLLGLPPRQTNSNRVESKPRLGLMAGAVTVSARQYEDRTLIGFPENPKLQSDWEHILAKVKAERASWSVGVWINR